MRKHYIVFGYQMQNGEYSILPKEAEAVKYIFDAYADGCSLQQIAEHMTVCGPPYHSSDNYWNKSTVAHLLSRDTYCGTDGYPAIVSREQYIQVQRLRSKKSVSYSTVLQPFRRDMQCGCCGEQLYWHSEKHQWSCRHCGMWTAPILPKNLSQLLCEKLYWIRSHSEKVQASPKTGNLYSIEVVQLDREINALIASPSPNPNAIISKILHRAELQFDLCSAGDSDPTTMQIKRACKETKVTDGFPQKLYTSIVSKVILYRDTHIEIKLRNGQIL